MEDTDFIPVDIVALLEDEASSSPIVLLRDAQSNRILTIWIGEPEARAIAIALNKMAVPRPLTHQLMLQVIQKMGGKLSRVAVDRLANDTYYATIYIIVGKEEIAIDARPSDAIAIGIEARVPLFVVKSLMDKAGQKNPFPPNFKLEPRRQKKIELKQEDMEKMKGLLQQARQREQKSSEQ